jgi:2,3-bisphosphoglycerate-dependent phosphoglycerate mutase
MSAIGKTSPSRPKRNAQPKGVEINAAAPVGSTAPAGGLRPMGGYDAAFLTNTPEAAEIVLVRHGEQNFDFSLTVGGLVDPPLSERGQRQAKLVGERFKGHKIDALYSSNLKRAYDTGAQIASHHLQLEHIVDSNLREVEIFRDLPGDQTPLEAIGRRQLLGMRYRMQSEKRWDAYGFSESSLEFRTRVVTTIEGIIAEHPGQRVVIACHGGVIAVYTAHILGLAQDMWFRPGHTSVHLVRALGTVRAIDFVGDMNHLQSVDPALVSY